MGELLFDIYAPLLELDFKLVQFTTVGDANDVYRVICIHFHLKCWKLVKIIGNKPFVCLCPAA